MQVALTQRIHPPNNRTRSATDPPSTGVTLSCSGRRNKAGLATLVHPCTEACKPAIQGVAAAQLLLEYANGGCGTVMAKSGGPDGAFSGFITNSDAHSEDCCLRAQTFDF